MHIGFWHFFPFPSLLVDRLIWMARLTVGPRQGKTPMSLCGKIATSVIWGEEWELKELHNMWFTKKVTGISSSLHSIAGEGRERKHFVTTQLSILCFTTQPPFKQNENATLGAMTATYFKDLIFKTYYTYLEMNNSHLQLWNNYFFSNNYSVIPFQRKEFLTSDALEQSRST